MSGTRITDELIDKIAKELAAKYRLSADQLSEVGKRLSEEDPARQAENDAFAEHSETFERLAR